MRKCAEIIDCLIKIAFLVQPLLRAVTYRNLRFWATGLRKVPESTPDSTFFLRSIRRGCLQGVVGPVVPGITALQDLFNLKIGGLPEAFQIPSDLDRAARRREEVEEHGYGASGDGRSFKGAEHLLKPHAENGRLRIRVVNEDAGAASDREMGGGQPVQGVPMLPG